MILKARRSFRRAFSFAPTNSARFFIALTGEPRFIR
jgi:hypothetical protein